MRREPAEPIHREAAADDFRVVGAREMRSALNGLYWLARIVLAVPVAPSSPSSGSPRWSSAARPRSSTVARAHRDQQAGLVGSADVQDGMTAGGRLVPGRDRARDRVAGVEPVPLHVESQLVAAPEPRGGRQQRHVDRRRSPGSSGSTTSWRWTGHHGSDKPVSSARCDTSSSPLVTRSRPEPVGALEHHLFAVAELADADEQRHGTRVARLDRHPQRHRTDDLDVGVQTHEKLAQPRRRSSSTGPDSGAGTRFSEPSAGAGAGASM